MPFRNINRRTGLALRKSKSSDHKTFEFLSLLEESKQIRQEFISIQESMRRMSYYSIIVGGSSLAFLSAIIEYQDLSTPDKANPNNILIVLGFLLVTFLYISLCLNYLGLSRNLLHLSNYHISYLSPKIIEITKSQKQPVFQWLYYIRDIRKSPTESIGYLMKFASEFMLIFLPTLISMLLFNYAYFKIEWPVWFLFIIDSIYVVTVLAIIVFLLWTFHQSRKKSF